MQNTEEYDENMVRFLLKWEELTRSEAFSKFFLEFKLSECRTTIAKQRRAAGLGLVPVQFTTNDCENINGEIKLDIEHTNTPMDRAVQVLHQMVTRRFGELKRSLFGEGKFIVVSPHIQVCTLGAWSLLSKDERTLRVQNAGLGKADEDRRQGQFTLTQSGNKFEHKQSPETLILLSMKLLSEQ